METVEEFNKELLSISSTKPPISKAKITGIVRLALKATHYYKYVVQSVEKFIWKCKPQYKLPGLYVIDAIIHQARLQFKYKDVYAPRFGRNMYRTFNYVFQCPDEDRKKVMRVLNLWSLNDFFKDDVLKPIFELAEQIEKKKQEEAEEMEGEKKSEKGNSDNEEDSNKKILDSSLDEDSGGMSKDLLQQLASLQSSLQTQNMGDLLTSMQDNSSASSLTKGIEFLLSNPNLIKQLGELQSKFSLNQIKDLETIVESSLVSGEGGGGGGVSTAKPSTPPPAAVEEEKMKPHPHPHPQHPIPPQLLAEESEFEKFLQENEQRAAQRSTAERPDVVDLSSPDQQPPPPPRDMDLRSIHLPQQQQRHEEAAKHLSTNFNLDDICLPSNLNEIHLPPPPLPPPPPASTTDLTSDLPMNLPSLPPPSAAPASSAPVAAPPMFFHHHGNERNHVNDHHGNERNHVNDHHGNEHHHGNERPFGNALSQPPNFSVPPPALPPPQAWMMSEPPPPLPLPSHYSSDMEMSVEMETSQSQSEAQQPPPRAGGGFPPARKSRSRSPASRSRRGSSRDRKRSRSREGSSRRKRRNRSRSRERRRGSRERRRGGRSPRRGKRSRSRERKRGRRGSESPPRSRFTDRERGASKELSRNSRETSVRRAGSREVSLGRGRAGSREVSQGRGGRAGSREGSAGGRGGRRSRDASKEKDRGRSSRERSGEDEEEDKERRAKGFPFPKKDHISICSKTIWVGHLPKTIEEEELRSMFTEYGDIAVLNLIPPRGCAFVTLRERAAAANALRGLRHARLGGKSLSLDWAPGKNCKDGEYRDYWNVELGVTYLPYASIESTNFESLIEGCAFDLATVPEFLRARLEMIQASYEARVLAPAPPTAAAGAPPPPDLWAPVPPSLPGAPPGFFPPGGPQGPPPGWFPPGGPGGPPLMPPMGIRLPPPPGGQAMMPGGPGGPHMGMRGGPPFMGPPGAPGGPPRPRFMPFTIGGPMGPRPPMRGGPPGHPPMFDGPPPRGGFPPPSEEDMRPRPPGLSLYDEDDDVDIEREKGGFPLEPPGEPMEGDPGMEEEED